MTPLSPAERLIDLYDRTAGAWDLARGSELAGERGWMERFAGHLAPGASVLDIGCGTGRPLAAWLVARGFAVAGLDAAPSMIALCRRRIPAGAWILGDMRGMALGRRFHGLLAWNSVFHLATNEQRAVLARFRVHAEPGAVLMLTTGPAPGERVGSWQGEPLFHASLAPDEYEALLAAHGFALIDHRLDDPTCGGSSVWLARAAAEP